MGIVREVFGIQERNEARKYAANRPQSANSFESDGARGGDISIMKSSEYTRSISPSKLGKFNAVSTPILKKKDIGNDSFSVGMLKSIR